jgi:UDP-N-acetylmuramoylalanine--D-glutamate ligase
VTNTYSGMTVNVVGLGATGLSLVRFLHERGAALRVFDSNATASGREQLASEFPSLPFTQIDLARDTLPRADFIALSPGVPRASPAMTQAIDRGTKVVGDIELFAQENNANRSIFAITGSNGKTTTVSISGALAQEVDLTAKTAGNIGLPVLDAMRAYPQTRTWVLELSSFQLESTSSLDCECATVLNVTDNHLDRYPSFFAYAASKERVFARAKRQAINRDDPWSSSMRKFSGERVSFGRSAPRDRSEFGVRNGAIARGDEPIVAIEELSLRGEHNTMNAMAALAVTASLDLSTAQVQRALRGFAGVPHRYEWLGNVGGVEIVNDSKATTVVATVAALNGSDAPTWLIAGGDGKGQSFDALANAASRCRAVHLVGRDAPSIAAALSRSGVANVKFDSLEDAVASALERARPGERVLLSPACASWDMFRNFEHRAEVFATTVRNWAAAKGRVLSRERGHA